MAFVLENLGKYSSFVHVTLIIADDHGVNSIAERLLHHDGVSTLR